MTDHKPVPKKFTTLSEEEDEEYFEYIRGLEDYNKKKFGQKQVSRFNSGRYELGSLKQKIFEPLATAVTLDNGSVFYELSDKEIAQQVDEGKMRS